VDLKLLENARDKKGRSKKPEGGNRPRSTVNGPQMVVEVGRLKARSKRLNAKRGDIAGIFVFLRALCG
jgi:hypothetical protein